MYQGKAICDRCKKEDGSKAAYSNYIPDPDGWREIELKISQYNIRKYLFCQDCCKELGLITDNPKKEATVQSVEERLIECIVEIVKEIMPNE